jgi:hypothetical protein
VYKKAETKWYHGKGIEPVNNKYKQRLDRI